MKMGKCPGIAQSIVDDAKRGRASTTAMYCEECSAQLGKTIYLCNINNHGGRSVCHIKHHNQFHCKLYLDAQKALKEMDSNNVLL